MRRQVDKAAIVLLFRSDAGVKPAVMSIMDACKDDFLRLLLSVLFKVPLRNAYCGMRRSPAILKRIINLIFGLEIELGAEPIDPKKIDRAKVLDLLITIESLDPDIIDVDRDFVMAIAEGQKVKKAGRIHFECFRNKVSNLDFAQSCIALKSEDVGKLRRSAKRSQKDFSYLTLYYPELLTYYAAIDTKRHMLFVSRAGAMTLDYNLLVKKGYRAIRTYVTAYSIVTKNKCLDVRTKVIQHLESALLYRTLNAFILETPEIVEYVLDTPQLDGIIENVPSFYIAFDALLQRALADGTYLDAVAHMLHKCPIRSNVEKAKCLRSRYPEFVKSIENIFN